MKDPIATIWLILWLVTYPALFANLQAGWEGYPFLKTKYCRRDMGFSMLLATLPPAWIATPFLTGFYETGFQFTCSADKMGVKP